MTTYFVDGHEIAVEVFNADEPNPAVVFIHGILASTNFWADIQPEWLSDKRWISLGLPGHFPGAFPAGFKSETLTPQLIAKLLWGALSQAVGDEPVILGGYSTGGFAALAMAAFAPQRVVALFTAAGFVAGRWQGVFRLLQWQAGGGWLAQRLFQVNLAVLKLSHLLFYHALRFYAADVKALYAYPRGYALTRPVFVAYRCLNRPGMLAWFRQMPKVDITPLLAQITAPTLVIHGNCDPIVPFWQGQLIAEQVANSRLVTLAGAGHLLMFERVEAYNRVLVEWLSDFVGGD